MQTIDTNLRAAGDGFSFSRVAALAAYYRPFCAKQLICYGLLSLAFAILTLLPMPDMVKVAIFTICWGAIPILYSLAPIVLAKSGDSRIVERMIPASAAEKFCFYALYFWVAVPIAVYLLPFLANLLYLHIPSIHTKGMAGLVNLQMHNPAQVLVLNCMTSLAISLTCLYVILSAKSARIVKAVILAFAVQFGFGLFAGILGGFVGFNEGFKDGLNGEMERKMTEYTVRTGSDPSYLDGVNAGMEKGFDLAGSMVSDMINQRGVMITLYIIIGVYLLIMFWCTYRYLKRANL